MAKNKQPSYPHDLIKWHWIKLDMLPTIRALINAEGEKYEIIFNSNISVNSVEAMTQLFINGAGIATPTNYLIKREISAKVLVELLASRQVESISLYAIWPNNIFSK